MRQNLWNRRTFLERSLVLAAGAPFTLHSAATDARAADNPGVPAPPSASRRDAVVAIVPCRSYGPEVRAALDKSFDLLGGIGSLVKDKTVTVKLNLTGTNFAPVFGKPVGETYMTHFATALALASSLFAAGARRVRFVESTVSKAALESTLALADWDVKALEALGKMEFENTRNLGYGKSYPTLRVPTGGYMFSSFNLNHAFADTDVMVSLAKLKNHVVTGVTLSMKNLFGATPNALYSDDAGSEDATGGRGPLHDPSSYRKIQPPGLKNGITSTEQNWRVPRIVADLCAARPIHLAIIDGITSMSGGEGPWCSEVAPLKPTAPGVLVVGLNPVSTDAVATAVMGYPEPRAKRGIKPFAACENHLVLAEEAGVGVAGLGQIDVRGTPLAKAVCPYG